MWLWCRDLKPENILVKVVAVAIQLTLMAALQGKQPPHILLADFDIAQDDSNQTTLATSVPAGTPAYMSPESLQGERPGEKHDIWWP